MTIKTMQTRLNEAGFSCGAADGVFGKGTLSALMGYVAKRQPDDAIRDRAKTLLVFWLPKDDRNPQGWTPLRMGKRFGAFENERSSFFSLFCSPYIS